MHILQVQSIMSTEPQEAVKINVQIQATRSVECTGLIRANL